jgi:hypothetical protein
MNQHEFVAKHDLWLKTVFMGLRDTGKHKDQFEWVVTLGNGQDEYTTHYYMGLAHCRMGKIMFSMNNPDKVDDLLIVDEHDLPNIKGHFRVYDQKPMLWTSIWERWHWITKAADVKRWLLYCHENGHPGPYPAIIATAPAAEDVVLSLAMDCSGVEGMDFWDWLSHFGMESNRESERIYQACQDEARDLKNIFGHRFFADLVEIKEE